MTAWNDPLDQWDPVAWGRPVSGIRFTQHLLPAGERRPMWIDRPAEIETMAKAVVKAGCRFDIEKLLTGEVSMSIERGEDDVEVLAIEICTNGPAVPKAVDRLVTAAHRRLHARAERAR